MSSRSSPSGDQRVATVDPLNSGRPLVFELHTLEDRYISDEIAELGQWEPFETTLVSRLVSSDSLLVDCGANIGWYTVIAAARGARVVAFEPAPRNFQLLERNVAINGVDELVLLHHAGVGREAGTALLELSPDNQGDRRLSVAPVGATVAVPIMTLDDALEGQLPTVLKIDTQGSEVCYQRNEQICERLGRSARGTAIINPSASTSRASTIAPASASATVDEPLPDPISSTRAP